MSLYYDPDDLRRLAQIGQNQPKLAAGFFGWYGAVFEDGALPAKTKALAGLAVAHALQCPYCIDAYTRSCLENGADIDQMTETLHLAAAVRACATLAHGMQTRRHIENASAPSAECAPLSMKGRRSPLSAPAAQLAELDRVALKIDFPERLREAGHWPLRPAQVEVLQLNICRRCNQTCRHCHVDAGPDRDELMSRETMESCLAALERSTIPTVDITGGAPELNPHFRWLLERCRAAGRQVMTRCNLTVLASPGNEDLPELFARQKVALICSLPHARKRSTDLQRGRLAFEHSIEALRRLNAVGYGDGRSGLELTLVANPIGDWLPGSQRALEQEWKAELARNHGIRFDRLICIANMPIGRHLEWLVETGKLSDYLTRLAEAFNPRAVPGVMCRATLSVGWDGRLYDCDFNQMLGLNLDERAPQHIAEFALEPLERRQIRVARHCFGCTAGAGSSCSGATT